VRNRLTVVLIATLLVAAIAIVSARLNDDAWHTATGEALTWAMTQHVPIGHVQKLILPPHIHPPKRYTYFDVAHLADGRYCILLISNLGWKDNFEGRLACSGPILASEIQRPDDGRHEYISLPGYGVFEELYIAKARSDHEFEVYFDLN